MALFGGDDDAQIARLKKQIGSQGESSPMSDEASRTESMLTT